MMKNAAILRLDRPSGVLEKGRDVYLVTSTVVVNICRVTVKIDVTYKMYKSLIHLFL